MNIGMTKQKNEHMINGRNIVFPTDMKLKVVRLPHLCPYQVPNPHPQVLDSWRVSLGDTWVG